MLLWVKGVNTMNDEQIVEQYLSRNESAIRQTKIKYGKQLRSISFQIVADLFTAEECENDTYLKAWNAIPPHQPKTYLFAFLARITRHLSLNCCRNRSRLKRQAFVCEFTKEMEQCIPSPDAAECCLSDLEFSEMINSFLEQLEPRKRNVFLRRYWYLDSIQDIAKRYGMGESAVKTMLFRIREQLREFLQKEGYRL